ncbi:hypothetical protein ACH4TX_08130 [Streptomyces sp. NPDC021098]|uniref:hypothetical protein n=1 Tax=unclassified Streptomyces TaxID=2593676 RepID=UPI0037920092
MTGGKRQEVSAVQGSADPQAGADGPVRAADAPPTPSGHATRWQRPFRGPLRAELTRWFGPVVGATVLVALLFAMAGKAHLWLDAWISTADYLRTAGLLVGGSLTAAAACWQGGRERRRGTRDLLATMPRTPLRRALLAAAPTILWPVAGYLLTAAVCLVATWQYASYGRPWVSLMVADATALGALGVLGFLTGRVVPWRLAPPLVAVGTYLALGLPTYSESATTWLSPALQGFHTWERPLWWFAPVSMMWTAGLAGAALLAYAARRRVTALVPLAAAATAAALLTQLGTEGPWRPDPAAAALVCDDGTPQVCAARVHARMLPGASAAVAGLSAKLRGVPNAPARVVESESSANRKTDARVSGWDTYFRPDRAAQPEFFAYNAAAAVADPAFFCPTPDTRTRPRSDDISSAVVDWLAPLPGRDDPIFGPPPQLYTRTLTRLRTMPDRDRTRWLGDYLAAAHSCRLERVTAP